jgi:hypothetical protein
MNEIVDLGVYTFTLFMSIVLIFVVYNVWKKRLKLTFGNIIFLSIFFGVFITVIVKLKSGQKRYYKEYKEYFKNFNISFVGKIYDMRKYEWRKDLQPGAGPKFNIYFLEILKSSVKNYDPSDTSENFYCIIKDSVAMLIEETIHDKMYVGDILYYNGKKDTMYHYTLEPFEKSIPGSAIKEIKYETILYEKWRPKNILDQQHKDNMFREYKNDWTLLIRNP